MKNVLLLLVSFSMISCGKFTSIKDLTEDIVFQKSSDHIFHSVDPVLASLYQSFEKEVGHSPWSIPSGFLPQCEENQLAYCSIYSDGHRDLAVCSEYWNDLSDTDKKQLIYHELGHCVLNYEHNSHTVDFREGKIPASIMYPTLFIGASYYLELDEEYVNAFANDEEIVIPESKL